MKTQFKLSLTDDSRLKHNSTQHLRENKIGFKEHGHYFPNVLEHKVQLKFEQRPNIQRQQDAQKVMGITSLYTV